MSDVAIVHESTAEDLTRVVLEGARDMPQEHVMHVRCRNWMTTYWPPKDDGPVVEVIYVTCRHCEAELRVPMRVLRSAGLL